MRASGSGNIGGGGGIERLLPVVFNLLGVKGTVILLVCVGAYGLFTGNLGKLLTGLGNQQDTTVSRTAAPIHETAEEKELVDFVAVILADTEDTWTTLFRQEGRTYKEPRLVLFRDAVNSPAEWLSRPWGPFIVQGINKSTSTWVFMIS